MTGDPDAPARSPPQIAQPVSVSLNSDPTAATDKAPVPADVMFELERRLGALERGLAALENTDSAPLRHDDDQEMTTAAARPMGA
jgi:hypothetical protein